MNIKTVEGQLSGKNRQFALVVSRFNSFVTERLLEGATDCLVRHGTDESSVTAFRVPGAWEIPLIAQNVAASDTYDAVICLGAVIRGDTPHFEYVAAEVSKGIATLSLNTGKPMSFGILTTDTVEQAIERAGAKAGNKGWEAALSALEMVDLLDQTK